MILIERIAVTGTMSRAHRKYFGSHFLKLLVSAVNFFVILYTHRYLWMTSSWWLVLRILLKMLVSSYLRLFVASISVSALSKNTLIWFVFSTFKFLEITIYGKITLNRIPVNWIFISPCFRRKRQQSDSDLFKILTFVFIMGYYKFRNTSFGLCVA